MNDILNPYIAGAPVVETSMFFGREDVFNWIETSLEGKYVGHILVLHGQRRVGKTSVLKQIPHFLPKKYIQVFFDFQGRTSTTLDRFLWWIASEIVRTLQKEHNIVLPKPDRKVFEDTEFLINEFLPSLRSVLGEFTLLLTFDEFDSLDRADIQETLAKPLIAYLRRLIELEEFRFIFSIGSSGHKLENMQASYTDFFKSALYRKISFLTHDDCHRLITKPVENVIKYAPKAIDRIIEITSGHPYFTQLACHELFALCQKTGARKITSSNVEAILDDVIERGTVNLKFVWDEASDLEKWVLAGLAQVESASNQKLGQFLSSNRVRFSDPDLNSAVIHLRDKDVLTQDNRFVIHLLKLWLLANRPMDRVREELVQVNPIANRYIEIGDEYRDQGKLQEAIESYQQALNVHPNNLKAQSNIASIHLNRKSYRDAADLFDKCLKIDEDDVVARSGFCEAKLCLAEDAQSSGQNEQAIDHIKQILVINPAHAKAQQRLVKIFLEKSEVLLTSGKEDEALNELNLALGILPDEEQLSSRYKQIVKEKKERATRACLKKVNKALNRQRWDEAASILAEALQREPDNQVLQTRLLEVKDAPRQFQLKAYKQEAKQAIAKANWDKAISALETAIQLAPEDQDLKQYLEATRSDRAHAQIDLFSRQADKAVMEGNWEAAIKARQAALKLSPKDPTLLQNLEDTLASRKKAQGEQFRKDVEAAIAAGNWDLASQTVKDAMQFAPGDAYWIERDKEVQTGMHQAKLDDLLKQAKQARASGEWAVAIAALKSYAELNPQDAKVKTEIEKIQVEKRNSELSAFKLKAENAYKTEKWKEAIQAWESYLELKPDDAEMVKGKLQNIRKKAQIASDYEEAQAALRKKRYGQAIELLQGIIAQDPTYKTTSRLLVEAVEANKQRKPVWHRPWAYWAFGGIILALLGTAFGPKLWESLAIRQEPTPVSIAGVVESITETIIPSEITSSQPTDTPEPTVTQTATNTPRRPTDTPTPQPAWVTDFAEPILAYIANRTPDIVDEFQVLSNFWDYDTCGDEDIRVIDGEMLVRNCSVGSRHVDFKDFVVEVNVRTDQGNGPLGLAVSDINNYDCSFEYYKPSYNYLMNVDAGCNNNMEYYVIPYSAFVNIRVILKGDRVAYFINQIPIVSIDIPDFGPYWNYILMLFANRTNEGDPTIAAFSDFKVWDITGLDIP